MAETGEERPEAAGLRAIPGPVSWSCIAPWPTSTSTRTMGRNAMKAVERPHSWARLPSRCRRGLSLLKPVRFTDSGPGIAARTQPPDDCGREISAGRFLISKFSWFTIGRRESARMSHCRKKRPAGHTAFADNSWWTRCLGSSIARWLSSMANPRSMTANLRTAARPASRKRSLTP